MTFSYHIAILHASHDDNDVIGANYDISHWAYNKAQLSLGFQQLIDTFVGIICYFLYIKKI